MDVIPYPIQQTLWFIPWAVVLVQGVSLRCQWGKGLLNSFPHTPRDGYPMENLLIGEGQIPLHFFSELQYAFR